MLQVPTVRTERLVLREWREQDRGPFARMNADPVVMEHLTAPLPRADSDSFVDRMLTHWAERGYGLWAVEVGGDFAGFVGLSPATFEAPFTPAVEVGWRLDRPFWGSGLASEGARAALAFGFDEVGLDEILSWTAVTNHRSWRVMQRLGMQREGEFEHPGVPVDHPVRPHVLYRITADRWRQAGSSG